MAGLDQANDFVGPYAEAILRLSRRRIELFAEAGDDWRFAESLKSVSEDTAQEYEGRVLSDRASSGVSRESDQR